MTENLSMTQSLVMLTEFGCAFHGLGALLRQISDGCVTEKDSPGLPGPFPILSAIQALSVSLRTKIPEYCTWAEQTVSDSRKNGFHALSSDI
jgi:hypothetical protein